MPLAGTDAPLAGRGGSFVQSLARGLAVIRCFDGKEPEKTLTEVATATGLTRAAARRFLLTLVDLGYVSASGRRFALTPRVLELGYTYLAGLTLPQVAEPHLEQLVAQLHESASVSVLDGHDVVYVARTPAARIMTVAINVGTRFPAHATSMGRVLLAGLSDPDLERYLDTVDLVALTPRTVTEPERLRAELHQVRSQGWALVDQELEVGLRSVAAPLRDVAGRVVAATNVSTHASRTTLERIRRHLLPLLLASARAIEADLHSGALRGRRD